MIDGRQPELLHEKAFTTFVDTVNKTALHWALTGSFRLFLEDRAIKSPSDIDILTDSNGMNIIRNIFKDNIIRAVDFNVDESIRSIFGQITINGVVFDIMSEVENKVGHEWLGIPNLSTIEQLSYGSYLIPVLPLSIELEVSQLLSQEYKASIIRSVMDKKASMKQLACNNA